MTTTKGWSSPRPLATEAERLDAALAAGTAGVLPVALRELATLAGELAEALAPETLDPACRRRIHHRALALDRRRRRGRLLGLGAARGRPVAVAAGAGGAALGLAIFGLLLARRSHVVVRPA